MKVENLQIGKRLKQDCQTSKIYNYYLYERNREKQYPKIKDQLDMLYHDLKSGNLNNGTWITAIDAVKENNPKPEGPTDIVTMAHFAKLGLLIKLSLS